MGVKIKKQLLFAILAFSLFSSSVYSASVVKILEDNVEIKENKIIHNIKSFTVIENLTINDFFTDSIVIEGHNLKESEFLGNQKQLLSINLGNLGKGEEITINYSVSSGNTKSLLGADIYYLEGELHQLYPKEFDIQVNVSFIQKIKEFIRNVFKTGG